MQTTAQGQSILFDGVLEELHGRKHGADWGKCIWFIRHNSGWLLERQQLLVDGAASYFQLSLVEKWRESRCLLAITVTFTSSLHNFLKKKYYRTLQICYYYNYLLRISHDGVPFHKDLFEQNYMVLGFDLESRVVTVLKAPFLLFLSSQYKWIQHGTECWMLVYF